MKHFNDKECRLIALVALRGGRVPADDLMFDEFCEDGDQCTDTINRCFDKGALHQVQVDEDSFDIVLGS